MNRTTLPRPLLIGAAAILLTACQEEVPPPVYLTVSVARHDIVVSVSASGSIEPITTVEVKSKASGEIMEIFAETGDSVKAGTPLVKVDPRVPANALTQAQADYNVAQAQLANARSQLKRSEELFKTQSITEQEYDNAKLQEANGNAQLIRSRRALDDAKIAREDTDVKAPISGIIIARSVEIGSVISSATSNVSGGTVLMRMANLDTVQIRALIDETDIGKIQADLPVTITVDAYSNRPFQGVVLKVEPLATTTQNVTMFPVLVRIANTDGLLRPGMNADVEVHVGERRGVLAVPNAALRTQRDVQSAAGVLGVAMETVTAQLAAARAADTGSRRSSLGGNAAGDTANGNGESGPQTVLSPDGRELLLPTGVSADQMNAIFAKIRTGGGNTALSAEEQAVFQRVMQRNMRGERSSNTGGGPGMGGDFGGGGGGGGGNPGRGGQGGGRGGPNRRPARNAAVGSDFIVFVLKGGQATAVPVRTGLSDLDYSEVVRGIAEGDSVMLLPSASMVQQQQEFTARMQRGQRGLPGLPGSGATGGATGGGAAGARRGGN